MIHKDKQEKMKVSFDFDGTLSRPDVQEYAEKLIKAGVEVIVTTARFDEEHKHLYPTNPTNEDLYAVADRLGIKRENIHFTNMEDKVNYLQDDIAWHLDDDDYELEEIKISKPITQGVDVNRGDWIQNCEYFLMVEPKKENYGWHTQCGFDDEPTGWLIEGGEEAYKEAIKQWETKNKKTK